MSTTLINHIPQAVGKDWIFHILELNASGDGATYKYSHSFERQEEVRNAVQGHLPDLVAGILHYWVSVDCSFGLHYSSLLSYRFNIVSHHCKVVMVTGLKYKYLSDAIENYWSKV